MAQTETDPDLIYHQLVGIPSSHCVTCKPVAGCADTEVRQILCFGMKTLYTSLELLFYTQYTPVIQLQGMSYRSSVTCREKIRRSFC